jgi:hypothetical protein
LAALNANMTTASRRTFQFSLERDVAAMLTMALLGLQLLHHSRQQTIRPSKINNPSLLAPGLMSGVQASVQDSAGV